MLELRISAGKSTRRQKCLDYFETWRRGQSKTRAKTMGGLLEARLEIGLISAAHSGLLSRKAASNRAYTRNTRTTLPKTPQYGFSRLFKPLCSQGFHPRFFLLTSK